MLHEPRCLSRADGQSHRAHDGDADERSALPLSEPRIVEDQRHAETRRQLDEVEPHVVQRSCSQVEEPPVQGALQGQRHFGREDGREEHHEPRVFEHLAYADEFALQRRGSEDGDLAPVRSNHLVGLDEQRQGHDHG
jgi:hypothetical protein